MDVFLPAMDVHGELKPVLFVVLVTVLDSFFFPGRILLLLGLLLIDGGHDQLKGGATMMAMQVMVGQTGQGHDGPVLVHDVEGLVKPTIVQPYVKFHIVVVDVDLMIRVGDGSKGEREGRGQGGLGGGGGRTNTSGGHE